MVYLGQDVLSFYHILPSYVIFKNTGAKFLVIRSFEKGARLKRVARKKYNEEANNVG